MLSIFQKNKIKPIRKLQTIIPALMGPRLEAAAGTLAYADFINQLYASDGFQVSQTGLLTGISGSLVEGVGLRTQRTTAGTSTGGCTIARGHLNGLSSFVQVIHAKVLVNATTGGAMVKHQTTLGSMVAKVEIAQNIGGKTGLGRGVQIDLNGLSDLDPEETPLDFTFGSEQVVKIAQRIKLAQSKVEVAANGSAVLELTGAPESSTAGIPSDLYAFTSGTGTARIILEKVLIYADTNQNLTTLSS
jgi:hypothetical protein